MNHTQFILEAIGVIRASEYCNEIEEKTCELTAILEIDHFIVTGLPIIPKLVATSIMLNRYPAQWIERYLEKDYIAFDPVASACIHTSEPFLWQNLTIEGPYEDKSIQVMREAAEYGLREGLSIPIHTHNGFQGYVSFAGRKIGIPAETIQLLQLFAYHMHGRLRYLDDGRIASKPRLSEREKEVLLWAAVGKTNRDIADILSISERTVLFHWSRVFKKLETLNKTHSVAHAIQCGLINP